MPRTPQSPLNEEGRPLEELREHECWTLDPAEGRLAAMEKLAGRNASQRVALRDLFRR